MTPKILHEFIEPLLNHMAANRIIPATSLIVDGKRHECFDKNWQVISYEADLDSFGGENLIFLSWYGFIHSKSHFFSVQISK